MRRGPIAVLLVLISITDFMIAAAGAAAQSMASRPAEDKKGRSADPAASQISAAGHAANRKASSPDQKPAASQKSAEGGLASEESLARFQQVLAKRPLHDPAFQGLVKHYAEQGRLSDLVKEYEQKVAALGDQPALKIVLARLYLRAGHAQKAADIIDKISKPPTTSADDVSKLLVFKADVYQQIGRNEAAQSMLEE